MKPKKDQRRERQRILAPRAKRRVNCYFCDNKVNPDYKDYETLSRFVTDQGKIVSGLRSGLCAKHQRRVARGIKQARHMAFLPLSGGF